MTTDPDQALLNLLRGNARASTTELARRLGLSRTTVQSRIERLERKGVIAGYSVR
ncbi:AsnC family transcriptional regulator, partial [Salmonella enterica subsp. enterica serovar Java]|nr:AsnC family transcriptional regulator [Salmonella enterica subsp. enterica serovar Java]